MEYDRAGGRIIIEALALHIAGGKKEEEKRRKPLENDDVRGKERGKESVRCVGALALLSACLL